LQSDKGADAGRLLVEIRKGDEIDGVQNRYLLRLAWLLGDLNWLS